MTLQWVSADLRTGQILADLPTFVPEWPLRRTLCKYETAVGDLYLDGAPPNWELAVREGGAALACYDDDDDARLIQWAGIVTEQTRDTSKDSVPLSLVTAEGYLDRRFVETVSYSAIGQNAIASDLVERFVVDGAVPGLPLVVNNLDGFDGVLRDRGYLDSDNATVYARLSELASIDGGIEWFVDWEWSTDGTALVPVFNVGGRVGSSPPAGLDPAALFAMPGAVTEAQQLRSYADGKGANIVTAYSSGQGDTTPTSGPITVADFEGRPTFEYRYQPSSSITNTTTLVEYANAAVALLGPGLRPLTLTAVLLDETRHGGTWRIGDDVAYAIGGTTLDASGVPYELVRAFPGGLEGSARAVAYELNESASGATITPILAQASIEGT